MPSSDGRTTLAIIAASAGVSVATVSKVVNGRADVSSDTRKRVETLLRQHQYKVRRRSTQVRRSTATTRIELLVEYPMNGYSSEIMQGVLDAANEAQVSVALRVGTGAGDEDDSPVRLPNGWARDLVDAGRQAVIAVVGALTPDDVAAVIQAHLPLVTIDPANIPRARMTSVGSTNFAGGLAATQHLLSLGHRRIAYIGGPADTAHNQARLHGYRAAMEAEGLPILPGYVRYGMFHFQDGLVGAQELLGLSEPPTAIFAGSDETAAGVIEAARVRGLRVPEDLSVVGFDDTRLARFSSPPLTTVRQPLREMGGVALRTALRLAAGEKLDSHHVELATQLVVRGSTAPCAP